MQSRCLQVKYCIRVPSKNVIGITASHMALMGQSTIRSKEMGRLSQTKSVITSV